MLPLGPNELKARLCRSSSCKPSPTARHGAMRFQKAAYFPSSRVLPCSVQAQHVFRVCGKPQNGAWLAICSHLLLAAACCCLLQCVQLRASVDARNPVGRCRCNVPKIWNGALLGRVEEALPGEAALAIEAIHCSSWECVSPRTREVTSDQEVPGCPWPVVLEGGLTSSWPPQSSTVCSTDFLTLTEIG